MIIFILFFGLTFSISISPTEANQAQTIQTQTNQATTNQAQTSQQHTTHSGHSNHEEEHIDSKYKMIAKSELLACAKVMCQYIHEFYFDDNNLNSCYDRNFAISFYGLHANRTRFVSKGYIPLMKQQTTTPEDQLIQPMNLVLENKQDSMHCIRIKRYNFN